MRYIRKQSEVLAEESGLLRTMTPSEVWNSEHDSKRAAQATLSYLGITIDSEFRSVSAFLRSFAESPFGEIRLGVETPEGRVWLSPDHASDHICTDKHWYPLYDDQRVHRARVRTGKAHAQRRAEACHGRGV